MIKRSSHARLAPESRRILELLCERDRCREEIARVLKAPPHSVGTRLQVLQRHRLVFYSGLGPQSGMWAIRPAGRGRLKAEQERLTIEGVSHV